MAEFDPSASASEAEHPASKTTSRQKATETVMGYTSITIVSVAVAAIVSVAIATIVSVCIFTVVIGSFAFSSVGIIVSVVIVRLGSFLAHVRTRFILR
jgi:hypothetical protein